MGTAEIIELGIILARLAERALKASDNPTAQKIVATAATLFAGYAATGRVDEKTATQVRALGEKLDALKGEVTAEAWKASAEETRRVTDRWNAAGKA